MSSHPAGRPPAILRVMIVANYSADAITSNNRFNDLARRFAARGADVELVTSRFSHARKVPRTDGFGPTPYTLTRLHEPGYARNISPARLRSQAVFAREVTHHLDGLAAPPDLLLAAAPPPAVAAACGRYARRTGCTFAIDVQDLWPEAFAMVARFPRLIGLAFSGMRRLSREAYTSAHRVIGVSRTYTEAAVRDGADPARTRVVLLGTDLGGFDAHADAPMPPLLTAAGPLSPPVIGYAGGLSDSYDLGLVIDALALLHAAPDAPPRPTLLVMGDGARREEFTDRARRAGVDARFTGNLPYAQMARGLAACEIAVNPIVAGSAGSILNKAGDYAAAGLPVVSSQESPEYRELLAAHGAGISCAPGDAPAMAEALGRLLRDPGLRSRLGRGSRRMGEELFDRAVTYEAMIDDLLEAVHETRGRS
ncbi:glycosyltransferase family 4 protein [Brachybacterium hainanense]|uniref:Glycosyltransferase family 4 protein n=1 Tax=Brachybacterium hainanense TaxID=1541174 RepID=A0ABV6R759_9MICO